MWVCAVLHRGHVHTRERGEWAWVGPDRTQTFHRDQRCQQGKSCWVHMFQAAMNTWFLLSSFIILLLCDDWVTRMCVAGWLPGCQWGGPLDFARRGWPRWQWSQTLDPWDRHQQGRSATVQTLCHRCRAFNVLQKVNHTSQIDSKKCQHISQLINVSTVFKISNLK